MALQIISADHHLTRSLFVKDGDNFLNVSEFFCDSIQGEGIYTGMPSAFLRLRGCIMSCTYCDTKEVWKYGTQFTFTELFKLMDEAALPRKLFEGQHLVLTGGSPLFQQDSLVEFLRLFTLQYEFTPFIEIENEAVIMPKAELIPYISCWNNSPKIVNSEVSTTLRYQPQVLLELSGLKNSWFKFVISHEREWDEIYEFYLKPGLIRKSQVILMPKGETRAELEQTREGVVNIAIKKGVRYSSREHITLWDKKTGV